MHLIFQEFNLTKLSPFDWNCRNQLNHVIKRLFLDRRTIKNIWNMRHETRTDKKTVKIFHWSKYEPIKDFNLSIVNTVDISGTKLRWNVFHLNTKLMSKMNHLFQKTYLPTILSLIILFYCCQKQYTVQAEPGFKSVGFLFIFHIIMDRQLPIWWNSRKCLPLELAIPWMRAYSNS